MSKPSEEALFYGRCRLEGMLAENAARARMGEAPAYTEADFFCLAEEIRGAYRQAEQYDTP